MGLQRKEKHQQGSAEIEKTGEGKRTNKLCKILESERETKKKKAPMDEGVREKS